MFLEAQPEDDSGLGASFDYVVVRGEVVSHQRVIAEPVSLLSWHQQVRSSRDDHLPNQPHDARQVGQLRLAVLATNKREVSHRRMAITNRTADHVEDDIEPAGPVLASKWKTCKRAIRGYIQWSNLTKDTFYCLAHRQERGVV